MSHGNESLVIEPRDRLPCHRVSWQASTKRDECQDDDGCVISTNYQWRFRDRSLATKRQRTGNKLPLEAFNQFEISGARTISSFTIVTKSRESGNSISSSTNNHSSSFLEFDYLLCEYSSREYSSGRIKNFKIKISHQDSKINFYIHYREISIQQ